MTNARAADRAIIDARFATTERDLRLILTHLKRRPSLDYEIVY
jgi:hypothetical protein